MSTKSLKSSYDRVPSFEDVLSYYSGSQSSDAYPDSPLEILKYYNDFEGRTTPKGLENIEDLRNQGEPSSFATQKGGARYVAVFKDRKGQDCARFEKFSSSRACDPISMSPIEMNDLINDIRSGLSKEELNKFGAALSGLEQEHIENIQANLREEIALNHS